MDATTATAPGTAGTASAESWREGAERWHDRLYVVSDEFAEVAGIVNAGHGRLVDLAVLTLAEGHHVGPGLVTCAQYLAWKAGVSKATANQIVRIAKRSDELPHLCAALRAGEISLDQADVVAQLIPARYDQAATGLAKVAGVHQLRATLSAFRDVDDSDRPKRGRSVSVHRDDDGATITARVSNETADAFEHALQALTEDLYRQREEDAKKAAAAEGGDPRPFERPTSADALASMCETALQAGEAAHPGSERYLISLHLHTDAHGRVCLTDERGRVVGEGERRRILCDVHAEAVFHDEHGVAISVGRKTRVIGRKLRRAVLFRDRHTCAVPGCDATHGLEIHHVVHWEDGGATTTANLLTICGRHHRAHHQGLLLIGGNADLAAGVDGAVTFRSPDHRSIPDAVPARPVLGDATTRTVERLRRDLDRRILRRREGHHPDSGPVASTPSGERIDRHTFHLEPDRPERPHRPEGPDRSTPDPPLRT